VIDVSRT